MLDVIIDSYNVSECSCLRPLAAHVQSFSLVRQETHAQNRLKWRHIAMSALQQHYIQKGQCLQKGQQKRICMDSMV